MISFDKFPKQNTNVGERVRVDFRDDSDRRFTFGTIVRNDAEDTEWGNGTTHAAKSIIQLDDDRFVIGGYECSFRLITPEDLEEYLPAEVFLEEYIDFSKYAKRQYTYEIMRQKGFTRQERDVTQEVLQLRWLSVMGRKKAYAVMASLEHMPNNALYEYMCKHMPAFADHSDKCALGFTMIDLMVWPGESK